MKVKLNVFYGCENAGLPHAMCPQQSAEENDMKVKVKIVVVTHMPSPDSSLSSNLFDGKCDHEENGIS